MTRSSELMKEQMADALIHHAEKEQGLPRRYYLLTPIALVDLLMEKLTNWRTEY